MTTRGRPTPDPAPKKKAAPKATPQATTPPAASADPSYGVLGRNRTAEEIRVDSINARAANGGGARNIIFLALDELGLGALADWAWNSFLGGMSETQILDIELPKRPEYQTRFPGMKALQDRGQAITTGQYIELERQYRRTAKAFNLPSSFYDGPEDWAGLIEKGVDPAQYEERLTYREQVAMSDPRGQRLRAGLTQFYEARGLEAGDVNGLVTAWFIDPDKADSIIRQQFQAAVTAAASTSAGYGALSRAEAERIAGTGVTEAAAVDTFGRLASMGELTQNLPGQGKDAVTREEQLSGGFEGNAAAQTKIARTARGRVAAFEGGGNYASSQRGVSGLGSA